MPIMIAKKRGSSPVFYKKKCGLIRGGGEGEGGEKIL
jgi:hypothetical protein